MLPRYYSINPRFFSYRLFSTVLVLFLSLFLLLPHSWSQDDTDTAPVFRVCADPNNLPFSNEKQEGFENKIAQLFAQSLGSELSYTWWPQRRGFLRGTLNAGRCDVVMGVPAQYNQALTTESYYQSTYAFVYSPSADYQLTSLDDAILRTLRIGVHLIGDDYTNSPPAHALSQRRIVKNVIGYSVFGNYAEDSPPGKIVAAVAAGDIDTAIVWGPIAGYFAQLQTPPLKVVPLPPDAGSPLLPFSYEMAMGVRLGNDALKAQLDTLLEKHAAQIQEILKDYGVPLVGVAAIEEAPPADDQQDAPPQPDQAQAVPDEADIADGPADVQDVQIVGEVSEASLKIMDKNPYTGNVEAIAEGKEYYKMLNCYGCHGMGGGGGMGPSINDSKWKVGKGTDADVMQQIMVGRGKMPSFGDSIDPDQAWKIISFVRSLYRGSPDKVTW
jgi:mxaJ protein